MVRMRTQTKMKINKRVLSEQNSPLRKREKVLQKAM
jgi:hypothetical protein